MFVVTEADAAAIRTAFHQEGELSAAIELRRRFPGITDNAKARACARSIAGWTPLPATPVSVTRLRPGKTSCAGPSAGRDEIAGMVDRADADMAAGRNVTVATPEDSQALHESAMARLRAGLAEDAQGR